MGLFFHQLFGEVGGGREQQHLKKKKNPLHTTHLMVCYLLGRLKEERDQGAKGLCEVIPP